MKVFNLTDRPTSMLQQQGLINVAFKVGFTVIAPGSNAEVKDTAAHRQELVPLLACGAAAIGKPPEGYTPAPLEEPKERPAPVQEEAPMAWSMEAKVEEEPVQEPIPEETETVSEEAEVSEDETKEEGGKRKKGRRRRR